MGSSDWEEIQPWETAALLKDGKDPLKETIKKTAKAKREKDEDAWQAALKKARQNS